MVTLICEDTLRDELSDFITDFDDDVVKKLMDLCHIFDKSEEEMVSALMAYIISKNINESLNLDVLDQFEKYGLVKTAQNEIKQNNKKSEKLTVRSNTKKSSDLLDKCNFIRDYIDLSKSD